jgi:hypothetical protein
MKKARILLLAVVLLAAVCGVLAFKARNYSLNYCVSTYDYILTMTSYCPDFVSNSFPDPYGYPGQYNYYATSLDWNGFMILSPYQCSGHLHCPRISLVEDY